MQQHTPADGDSMIRVSAYRHGGRVASATIAMPDQPPYGARVIGLAPAAAAEALARQVARSPRAHARALAAACDAASGLPATDLDSQLAIERELAAEAADTHLRRLLIDWPLCLGMDARPGRYAEFHRRLVTKTDPASCFELGGDILDLVAREMLAGFFHSIRLPHSLAEFVERADRGGVLGAVLREMIQLGPSQPQQGQATPILGKLSAAAWVSAVGIWPAPEFIAHPTFAGEPAETGPLARHAASPLVRLLLDRGHRLSARLFAKAIDLADCASRMRYPFTDDVPPMIDTAQAAPGVGLARVSTARGVLLCWVRIEQDVIADCAIIPAGAWNFHPQGAFCREACAEVEETHEAALRRLSLLALALDPSLPYTVELIDEAPKKRRSTARTARAGSTQGAKRR
ncbi:hypothetical protein [Thauera linaloolentis]|uniref:Hydrogenase expression/formation protein HupK n=1 Tax=Thauera linaloolentis (strain DSM 12138 / JCM 21573 / CCUG 41526 / CIP 105981 / IAM 15112 / NBRC 102519 / 47Lol) TaxID=1123367 RepID=N6YUP3_THAL4|nr:hypothetical protein [Thauera linaloolentis]ENO86137.1 hypothetical protein C666_13880 [Thauera linaloolentis 47Lol = DSM 12138]MCM8564634.1 hypothetical protein [Thauera linaloolentis]